jgi:nicotinamide phosphoribosyltransferase
MTARKSMLPGVDSVVFFGLQYFALEYLVKYFDDNFFSREKSEVIKEYSRRIRTSLGVDLPDYKHIEALYDLGYLPLCIKALPEGSAVLPVLSLRLQNGRAKRVPDAHFGHPPPKRLKPKV